jgi:hypothetical protein
MRIEKSLRYNEDKKYKLDWFWCWIYQSALTLYNYIERLVCPLHIQIPSQIATFSVFCIPTYTITSVFVPRPMYPKRTGHWSFSSKRSCIQDQCMLHALRQQPWSTTSTTLDLSWCFLPCNVAEVKYPFLCFYVYIYPDAFRIARVLHTRA